MGSSLLLVAREPQQPTVPLLEEVLEPALLLSTPLLSPATRIGQEKGRERYIQA